MIRSLLEHWINSSPRLLLDFRPYERHFRRRVLPSTCIPLADIQKHWFELPPKHLPFAVLEPRDGKGSAKLWLKDNGWTVPWVFQEDDEELWRYAGYLGIVEAEEELEKVNKDVSLSVKYDKRRKWVLFQPTPFLAENIDLIEQSLLPVLSPGSKTRSLTLKCLDLGCGSGRDVAWLCSRSSASWHVTAVDNWVSALDRTKILASGLDVLDRVTPIHAEITADGFVKRLRVSPTNAKRSKLLVDVTSTASHGSLEENPFKNSNDDNDYHYDLVITIRFLIRGIFEKLKKLVRPGGYLLISTFVDDGTRVYNHPKGKAHRLKLGELRGIFEGSDEFTILIDRIELIPDGRPVNSFLVRKNKACV